MADKTEHAQVIHRKQKYKNPEYDDRTVESLMKYLDVELRTTRRFPGI